MANMSYCRFQNTSGDLQDCIDALDNFENDPDEGYKNLSKEEQIAADNMYAQCETYMRIYDEAINKEDEGDDEEDDEDWHRDTDYNNRRGR